jgi:NAD dependent epimerase/dehydratase family enzyme
VGSRLAAKLASQGNKVRVVTRNVNSAKSKLQYPGLEFFSLAQIADAVNGSDAVVNLAGEPIGTRCVDT